MTEHNMHSTLTITRITAITIAMLAGACLSPSASAQRPTSKGSSYGGNTPTSQLIGSGIAWFGVLQDGLKEANRTGMPILFVTAAPQCNGVPGMW